MEPIEIISKLSDRQQAQEITWSKSKLMDGPSSCWSDGQTGGDEAAGGRKEFETNLQEIVLMVSEPGEQIPPL